MKDAISSTSVEQLLHYFAKSFILNDNEKAFFKEIFHSRIYRKRQYVLQEGDVCTQFNFVVRGCKRESFGYHCRQNI